MDELHYLDELNMPTYMKIILQRLPYKLRKKWRTTACDILELHHRRPGFKDIVKYIKHQVKRSFQIPSLVIFKMVKSTEINQAIGQNLKQTAIVLPLQYLGPQAQL